MELEKGFKRTEAGVIPSDWRVSTIGNEYEIFNNLRFPLSSAVRSKMQGPFPYYGPTGIQDFLDHYRVTGQYALIGEDGDHFLKWRDKPMTLLVDGKFNVNNHAHLIQGKKNLTIWFFYSFYHKDLTQFLTRQGASRYKLTKASLLLIPCVLPSTIQEQEAITNALSDADAYIESLEKLIEKKRLIKKGVMQELLTGKRRLEGFNSKKGFKDTEIGKIPEDWQIKLLPEVCKFRSGKAHEQFIVDDGPFVCVNSKFISTEGAVKKYTSKNFCLARKNDILMVMSDLPNGKALAKVFMVDQDNLYAVNQRVCALTIYKDDPFFLGLQLNRNPYFLKFDDGVSQTHLLNRVFEKCHLILPTTVEEQKAISQIVMEMSEEILLIENKLQKARLIKQGMMQELLTGRIRLV